MDLAAAVEFDLAAVRRNIEMVRPGMRVFEVSAKTGQGMAEYLKYLSVTFEQRSRGAATFF